MSNDRAHVPLLASIRTEEFERARSTLLAETRTRGIAPVLQDALTLLASAPSLAPRERDRRVRLLLATLPPSPEEVRVLAERLRETAPGILNAFRGALQPEMRPLAVHGLMQASNIVFPETKAIVEPFIDLLVTAGTNSAPAATVVLVGTETEHANNLALLKPAGLSPLRVNDIESLIKVGPGGMCGFVIARSAWLGLDDGAQRGAVARVCGLSTFVFVRIATDGLSPSVAADVHDIAERVLNGRPDACRFCHARECDLTPADVQTMQRSAALLAVADGAAFFPLRISEPETALLRLIAADRRRPADPVTVRRLGARELGGGRSGAKLYLLQPSFTSPFVVKLGAVESLARELRHHGRWIADWESQVTQPALHLHLGAAAVSYRLQMTADGSGNPAPTLEEEIERLIAAEWLKDENPDEIAADLSRTINIAATRLADLNSRQPGEPDPGDFWLDWPVAGLAARQISVALPDGDGRTLELVDVCHAAMERLRRLHGRGIIHGDIHPRNILLVDRVPAFIDYTFSGPGHPLVDLVRLDASVRALALRAVVDESELTRLFSAIHVDGATAGVATDMYPAIARSPACRLAVICAVTTRTRALEVAGRHGAGLPEYLSMVAVVAGYQLAIRRPGSAVERACIRAVARPLFHGRQ